MELAHMLYAEEMEESDAGYAAGRRGAARRLAGTGRYQIGRSLFGFTGGRHMHRG